MKQPHICDCEVLTNLTFHSKVPYFINPSYNLNHCVSSETGDARGLIYKGDYITNEKSVMVQGPGQLIPLIQTKLTLRNPKHKYLT
jgi:hypothetical protein